MITLHLLMIAHTLTVLIAFACGPYIAWMTVIGKRSWLFWAAIFFPLLICTGRIVNGNECILQTMAKQLRGVETGWARDIYLLSPAWAMHIVTIGVVLYVSGMVIYFCHRGHQTEEIEPSQEGEPS